MRRRRRAEFTAKVRAQPAQSEREARPRRHAQHVRQHSQVESEGCLAAQTRSHVRQAARGVRMLPGPLKLRAGVRASGSPGEGGGAARGGPQAPAHRPAISHPVSFLTRRAATAEGKPCTMSTISLGKRTRVWPVIPISSHPVPSRIPSSLFVSSPAQEWSPHSRPPAWSTRPCPLHRDPSPRACHSRAPPPVTGTYLHSSVPLAF